MAERLPCKQSKPRSSTVRDRNHPDRPHPSIPWRDLCNLDHDPGCKWRDKDDWSPMEAHAIKKAIEKIEALGCTKEVALLKLYRKAGKLQLWDKRVTRAPGPDAKALQGRVDKPTGTILMWTGYDRQPHDKVDWAGTLAHEAIHVTLKLDRHPPAFYERLEQCTA